VDHIHRSNVKDMRSAIASFVHLRKKTLDSGLKLRFIFLSGTEKINTPNRSQFYPHRHYPGHCQREGANLLGTICVPQMTELKPFCTNYFRNLKVKSYLVFKLPWLYKWLILSNKKDKIG
jgi:hypothetical protein